MIGDVRKIKSHIEKAKQDKLTGKIFLYENDELVIIDYYNKGKLKKRELCTHGIKYKTTYYNKGVVENKYNYYGYIPEREEHWKNGSVIFRRYYDEKGYDKYEHFYDEKGYILKNVMIVITMFTRNIVM